MYTIIITALINLCVLYLIFHYFKWKITTYTFLDGYDKKKEKLADEINNMIIEINKTTERNLQLLEGKILQLNEVISKSEKIFNALKIEKDKDNNVNEIYQKLEKQKITSDLLKTGENTQISGVAAVEKNYPQNNVKNNSADDAVMEKNIKKDSQTSIHKNGKDNNKKRVISMYRNGIDTEIIAQTLGLSEGEVELIISIGNINSFTGEI